MKIPTCLRLAESQLSNYVDASVDFLMGLAKNDPDALEGMLHHKLVETLGVMKARYVNPDVKVDHFGKDSPGNGSSTPFTTLELVGDDPRDRCTLTLTETPNTARVTCLSRYAHFSVSYPEARQIRDVLNAADLETPT